jgi:hypothetical protein
MAVTEPFPARSHWEGAGLAMLIGGFLAGPAAWGLNLMVNYSLVKPACAAGSAFILTVVSLIALAVTGAGGLVSWHCWQQLRAGGTGAGGRIVDRSYFVALVGVALNLFFVLLIAVSTVPHFVLSPCE